MSWTVDSTAVHTDSTVATVDGFSAPGGAALAGVAGATATASAQLTVGASLAASGAATAGASGVLINFASVTLAAPLYTGIGGLLDPNFWVGVTPPVVGSVVFYDPTFVTILTNAEINSTNNNCSAAVQFQSPAGLEEGLIVLTPGLVAYAGAISSANATLSASAAMIAGSGSALAAASANLLTAIRLANATSGVASAAAALSAQIQLVASASALSSASGRLASGAVLAAAASDLASSVGALSTQILIAGAGSAVAGAAGALTTNKPLTGAALGITNAAGALSTSPGLPPTAFASAIASASGDLSTNSTLAGFAASVSSAFADLTTQILLLGSAAAISSGQGVLVNSGSAVGLYTFDPEFVVTQPRVSATQIFNELGPTEERVLTFDFTDDLDFGETLVGPITLAVTCTLGTDPTPLDVLNGIPAYNGALTQVMQPISAANAVVGCDYYFVVTGRTTNPQKVLARYAILPIRG